MGFDLVAFSGGKGIRGPQSAGLLLGRKDLDRRRAAERAAQWQHHRPRHEGQQGRNARHAGGAGALRREWITSARAASSTSAPRPSAASAACGPGREGRGVRARSRQPRAARARDLARRHQRASAAGVVSALRDGEPSIAIRSEEARPRHRRLDDAQRRGEGRGAPPQRSPRTEARGLDGREPWIAARSSTTPRSAPCTSALGP